jgi:hypothetical protein
LASIKDSQATGEAFSPQKRTSSTSKDENSVLFLIFWGRFCPPGSGSGSAICMRIRIQQLKLMRIRIRIRIRNPVHNPGFPYPGGCTGLDGVPGRGGEPPAREPVAEYAGRGERWAGLPLLPQGAGDRHPTRLLDRGDARPGARSGQQQL